MQGPGKQFENIAAVAPAEQTVNNPAIQAALALAAFAEAHPELHVDPTHPQENAAEVRQEAMLYWVGEDSMAEFFSRFKSENEQQVIAVNPKDLDDIVALLKKIEEYKNAKLSEKG